MKKVIFILIMTLCLSFTACRNNENSNAEIKNLLYIVDKVKVDNHDYLLARSMGADGISIIHSESCSCKKTNIYKKGE